jgi:DNA-binding SARP family transcriptional activator
MPELECRLFGKLCVQRGEAAIFELESRKAEELLCYLLLNRERPRPREALADVLWGGDSGQQSKSYLRKALWQLHAALDHLTGGEEERLLLVEADWMQINPRCDLWLDVAVVEAAFRTVKGVSGRELSPAQADRLEAAAALYRGELLEGWYQDWCLLERQRLQFWHLASLDKLMDYYEFVQDYERGLEHGERVLRYDRARERTHTRMMRLQYLAGDRTAALRQYELCREALRQELDVEPGDLTRQLYQQIRQDALPAEDRPPSNKAAPPDEAALQTIHSHLGYFQRALGQLQSQLREDIQSLERAMRKE